MSQVMKIKLINRLNNWKFTTAYEYAKGIADDIDDDVILGNIEALSQMFGNVGWFGGYMGDIVAIAVDKIVKDLELVK